MLTNIDIEKFCAQQHIQLVEVVMKDQLGTKPVLGNYIVNLQSSTQGDGTHWTALVVAESVNVFFDSFGAPPSQEVVEFCRRTGRRTVFNDWIVQDLDSDLCGWYCIGLLHAVSGGGGGSVQEDTNEYINRFGGDTKSNGSVLKAFFRSWCTSGSFMRRLLRAH